MSARPTLAVRQGAIQVIGWNAADVGGDSGHTPVLSGVYKQVSTSDGNSSHQGVRAVIGRTTGKWFYELLCGASWSGGDTMAGFLKTAAAFGAFGSDGTAGLGVAASGGGWNGTSLGASGEAPGATVRMGFAVDLDNNLGWWTNDGTNYSFSGTPASGTNGKAGGWSVGDLIYPAHTLNSTTASCTIFCHRQFFSYTIPTGFRPWAGD